jgi:hypothetical protein
MSHLTLRERLRDERGYTLIEMLLATVAGLVVCAAALLIVVMSYSFASSQPERVDANQQGGVAMGQLVEALESSCVEGYSISPIVGATGGTGLTGSTAVPVSSGNTITFYTSQSDSPTVIPQEDVAYLSGGELYLATYPGSVVTGNSGTTSVQYTATPSSTQVLLQHATGASGVTNVFSYYGYNAATGILSTSPYSVPLGATNAATTAEIGIAFQADPSDGHSATPDSGIDILDNVVLRLSAVSNILPPTGSTTPEPCE